MQRYTRCQRILHVIFRSWERSCPIFLVNVSHDGASLKMCNTCWLLCMSWFIFPGSYFSVWAFLLPKQRLGWMYQRVENKFALWTRDERLLLFVPLKFGRRSWSCPWPNRAVSFAICLSNHWWKVKNSSHLPFEPIKLSICHGGGYVCICEGWTGSIGVDYTQPCCQGSVTLAFSVCVCVTL